MTLVLLNDIDDSRVPQLFKNRQMRDETNNCLSVSVKKINKDAQTLKHSLIVKAQLSE